MIYPEKTYTNNPFVDNVIYYAKWLSMNCTVKDEEEALANETKETREAGDILISCVEGASSYELYKSIPKEIIEKYIQVHSNLDLYVESVGSLKLHLDHYDEYNKNRIINSLSETARNVFIDHYDTVTAYLESLEVKSEFDEYSELIDFVEHSMSWNAFFNVPEYREKMSLVFDKCIPEDRKAAIDTNLYKIIPSDVNTEIYNDFNIFYNFIRNLRDNNYWDPIDDDRFDYVGTYLDEGITIFISDLVRAYKKIYNDIVSRYTDEVINTYNWLDTYADLYEKCKLDYVPEDGNYTLSYEALISDDNDDDIKELYNIIPEYTRTRVIKTYLNNSISSPNNIYASYNDFKNHIISRTDISQINTEVTYIITAFRKIFISHYNIMTDRKYFSLDMSIDALSRFTNDDVEYENCKKGYSSYKTLFDYFPVEAIRALLINGLDGSERISIQDIDQFELDENLDNLIEYIEINKDDTFASELSKDMREVYINNYTSFINYDIYLRCKHDNIDYFELIPYLPFETQKMILNTEIEEFTNTQVYADSKRMLNSYLNTLPASESNKIKYNINKDMREWYPKNHIEKNNYYRSLIGLPPMDDNGTVYEDTLYHTWNETTGSFIEFGDRFIKQLPKDMYPEIHWRQNIYEFDAYDIGILNQYNILEDYIAACGANPSTPRYKYLRYLADNKLDIYTCRRALKYDLIGVPTIDDSDAKKRFVDCYMVNKDYVIRTVYSEAHKFQSDYYDKFMIIFILINTIMDMLSGITEMIIDREVFDSRCIEWLFESYGVPYYSEIPVKYLRAMLKNLNILLKYKSSTKNMIDICNLFGFNDVRVFGYYLFKDRNVDPVTGEYLFDDPTEITYNINEVWVKVPDQSPVIDDAVSVLYPAYTSLNNDGTYTDLLTFSQGVVNNSTGVSTNNNTSKSYFSSIFNIEDNKYINIMLTNNITYKIYQFSDSNTLISVSNEFTNSYSYRLNNNAKSARIYFYNLTNIEDIKYIEHISLSKDNKTYTDTDKMIKVDFNGILYMNLEDYIRYNEYEKDKYIKYIGDIETDSNELNTELEIVNNNADVYIYDQYYNEFIPLKDTHYFTKIKADTSPSTLKFIKVPIDDELSKYKNDPNYILSYDEITKSDEGDTWDGGLDHDDLKNKLLDHEFNAVKSKYISVETITDLTEQSFQVAYFYNMLFDNLYNEDGLTVNIPYLKIGHTFRFMDLICYLFALMYLYHGLEDNIMYSPTQILFVKGYNFDEALNQISDTILSYNASDENLNINDLDAKERQELINYFDINKEINKRNYDYQKQFEGYSIKEFNLEADIDELDRWLQEYTQMSLDDFIVDDSLMNFSQIITLRQFFTLNNSYYQKDIFNKTNIIPFNYNQEISYAYDYYLLDKKVFYDFDGLKHYYANIYSSDMNLYNKAALIIDDTNDIIYKLYLNAYVTFSDNNVHSLYRRYTTNSDKSKYNDFGSFYCYDSDTNTYYILFDNTYFIINNNNDVIFSADNFYIKNENDEYELVDEHHEIYGRNFMSARNSSYNRRYRLSLGVYWIQNNDGSWELDNNYVYFKVKKGNSDEYEFVSYSELSEHTNVTINEDDYYIRHDDGHFIKFTETDYYRFNSDDDIKSIYDYIKENNVYIRVSEDDNYNYTDTELDGSIYYYKDATEYLSESNWNYIDKIYVKIDNNIFIPEDELLSPSNLYFYENGNYELVYNNIATYTYSGPYTYINSNELNNITNGLEYTLILSNNGKYNKYGNTYNYYDEYAGSSGMITLSNEVWNFDTRTYLFNSNNKYITVLKDIDDINNYLNTKSFIVVLQKEVTYSNNIDILSSEKYNPEITDKVWDENDWFYPKDGEASSNIGLHGENIWYYRDPNNPNQETEEDQVESKVGSGFFIESSSYLGSVQLEFGNKYYMAFDFETNFSGEIQIYNTADDSVSSINDRLYKVTKGEKIHISQIFIANEIANPEIRILVYNFDKYPIHIGDYVVISNMRFVKATAHEDRNNPGHYNSNHYIAQDVPSYDMLQELYRTNEAIYKWLCTEMANESDLRKYNILKKIYDSLMVSKYNKEAFKIGENKYAKTYTDFLENRDSVLYSKLVRFKSIDPDTMHKEIADEIIEVTYAIDDCVDTYSYGFIYSYFPAVSATYIQQYITKIINWFKSWKVHLLGINTVYKLGDEYENTVKALETKEPRIKIDHYKKNVHIYDTAKINPIDEINYSGEKYTDLYPDMVEYSHIPKDECIPKDRVRIISRIADKIEFKDPENNMHIILNDNGTKVSVSDDNILNISSGEDGFSTNNDNELILTTEKNIDQYYAEQIIDEINLLSGDYLDRRNLDNE